MTRPIAEALNRASQAEAEAGTSNGRMMTPLRTKQAIEALGGADAGISYASSRTALAALAILPGAACYLNEGGRSGLFVFDPSNMSAQITADPLQGMYVAPDIDTTGGSGAWVRHIGIDLWVRAEWFGLDETETDQHAKIEAAFAVGFSNTVLVGEGDFWLGDDTYSPSGCALKGLGPTHTRFHYLPSMATGGPKAGFTCLPTADGCVWEGFSINGQEVGFGLGSNARCNGINARGTNFQVSFVVAWDCTGYAFWGVGDATHKASGRFTTIAAYSCDVLFETTEADGIVWDGMIGGHSANDNINIESVFHPTANSRNIHYRNGVFEGAAATVVGIVANNGDQDGLTFDNIHGVLTIDTSALYMASTVDGSNNPLYEISAKVTNSYFEKPVGMGGAACGNSYHGELELLQTTFMGGQVGFLASSGIVRAIGCTAIGRVTDPAAGPKGLAVEAAADARWLCGDLGVEHPTGAGEAFAGPTSTDLTGTRLNGVLYAPLTTKVPVHYEYGTSITLTEAMLGKHVLMVDTAPTTFTVPSQATLPLPQGSIVDIIQAGDSNPITVTPGSGVTIGELSNDLTTSGRYARMQLVLMDPAGDFWFLYHLTA